MSFTEKLIESVKRFPLLYDPSHPDHKNNRKRDLIWIGIGADLDEEGEELKKKWRNLRDTYAKYLRSIKTNGQAAKRSYKNWQWSRQMELFRPYIKFGNAESNGSTINDIESDPLATDDTLTIPDGEENSVDEILQSNEPEIIHIIPTTSSKPLPFKRQRTEEKTDNDPVSDALLSYLQNKRQRSCNMTANDLIFAGYAKTVSSFSTRRQAITKMRIAQILAEEELKNIEEIDFESNPSCAPNIVADISTTMIETMIKEEPTVDDNT